MEKNGEDQTTNISLHQLVSFPFNDSLHYFCSYTSLYVLVLLVGKICVLNWPN